jgi:hypothetical protein
VGERDKHVGFISMYGESPCPLSLLLSFASGDHPSSYPYLHASTQAPFFPSRPCHLSPNLRLLSHIFLDISATCLFRYASCLTATDSYFHFFPSVSPRNPVDSADAYDPFEWRRGAGCRESVSRTCSSSGKSFAFVLGIASSPPPAPRSRSQSSLCFYLFSLAVSFIPTIRCRRPFHAPISVHLHLRRLIHDLTRYIHYVRQ